MRRAAAAVALTIIGLWLVLSFKSSPVPRVTGVSSAATPPTSTSASQPTSDNGQPPAGPPPPSPTPVPPTTAPTTGSTRTVDGEVVSTRFGDVQVEAILDGSRIVDVKALQLPFDRPRSQAISDQAAPLLRDEVLQVQGAQIDTIGGATYTSYGYARSLQSALDKARG